MHLDRQIVYFCIHLGYLKICMCQPPSHPLSLSLIAGTDCGHFFKKTSETARVKVKNTYSPDTSRVAVLDSPSVAVPSPEPSFN